MTSTGDIRLLPDNVANKIAAGEVVERPASVAKELIENAVDSGATQIDVDIVAGGRKLVSVADNGCGMDRDNALLAVERHATSKITDVDDIENIRTLGFRGEALAAIASVSRFRLSTSRAGDDTGCELTIAGGKLQDVREIGCPPGTVIEVRDLFFNVPARKKFMRAHQTELAHIRDIFMIQALANPAMGMTLRVDGRDVHRLAGNGNIEDRLQDLFGSAYVKNLRPVDHGERGVVVNGFVSLPDATRADRNELYVFVNGRAATAPLVNYAIKEGYRALLPRGRHPSVFLFLSMAPDLVDVNVHPTKREVRFRRPSDVRDTLIAAIQGALGAGELAPGDAPAQVTSQHEARRPEAQVQLNIDNLPPTRTFRYPRMATTPQGQDAGDITPFGTHARPGAETPPARDGTTAEPAIDGATPATGGTSTAPWSWCRVLGQIGSLYVILETEEGYVVMDPRAAHERVLFERFLTAVSRGDVPTQALLIPETVELRPRDAALVRRNLSLFKRLGFGVSEFGGDAFVLDALPACFNGAHAGSILTEVAQDLEQAGARGAAGRWREESIAEAASRSAVGARERLTLEETEQLVIDLAKAEMPYTSPKGRPTLIFTSLNELNRKFGRT
jgi:DNA mismatch repair protein MutL